MINIIRRKIKKKSVFSLKKKTKRGILVESSKLVRNKGNNSI